MKIEYSNIFLSSYIFLLIAVFSINIFLGVVVIPTIFNSEIIFKQELLSKFNEGLLMTNVFIKLKFILIILMIYIFIYEFIIKFNNFKNDILIIITSSIVLLTSYLFIGYYIPNILELQNMGEIMTNSEKFISLHQASEINFKLLSCLLLILIYKNIKDLINK